MSAWKNQSRVVKLIKNQLAQLPDLEKIFTPPDGLNIMLTTANLEKLFQQHETVQFGDKTISVIKYNLRFEKQLTKLNKALEEVVRNNEVQRIATLQDSLTNEIMDVR